MKNVEYLDNGIQVSWNKAKGAKLYRVFYKEENGTWKKLQDTNKTKLTFTDLNQETAYFFTVRCLSADGKQYTSGFDSKGIRASRLPGRAEEYNFTSAYRNSEYYEKLMSVRLSDDARDNIVAVAMSQVGYHEGKYYSSTGGNGNGYNWDNYTEFGRWYYNHVDSGDEYYKGAWCSMFVSWCANEAGISSNTVPRRALVEYMDDAFRAKGRYYTWNETQCGYGSKYIQKGDLIFYSASPGGRLSHIGIVTDVTYRDNRAVISTVEGNVDDTCKTRRWIMTPGSNGCIDSKHYIRGFACPAY
jgi:cell wall-associated NlpC family hydrolase